MTLTLTYKGFDYVSDYNGAFEDNTSLASLAATGANSVAINIDYGIDAQNSTVYADPGVTESLTSLSNTILQAASLGLSVMVRPLIDFANPTLDGTLYGDWRETYEPTDPAAFFASYGSMIVAVASIAQADGAPMLDIGTELDELTGPQYLSEWTTIINEVKSVYSGKLTYSANWDASFSPWTYAGGPAGTGNIATQISFWNQLDFVGVDEYAPISTIVADGTAPTLQQLIDGWSEPPTDPATAALTGGDSLISYYESISTEIGKKLLFTEIGYQNATDAAQVNPNSLTGVENDALQGSLYTAFFDAWQQAGNSSLAGTYFWFWDPNAAQEGPGTTTNPDITYSPQGLPAQQVVTDAYLACFTAGTRIATADGERPVETLRPGDLVRTAAGALRPIRWIGRRAYQGASIAGNPAFLPVLIRAGAFAEGVPQRDLLVSSNHGFLLDGVLVPAGCLINGASIRQVDRVDLVRYFHIELDSHDILLAEGAPAESYLDTGNRDCFVNGPAWSTAHPQAAQAWDEACAELVTDGPRLAAIKRRLFERGATAQSPRLTLQVAAGPAGTLPAAAIAPGYWRYAVPPGTDAVWLHSDPFVPACCVADSLDRRRLGVRLAGIEIDGAPVPLDSIASDSGFYPCELTNEGLCRWTNGRARLSMPKGAKSLALRVLDEVK